MIYTISRVTLAFVWLWHGLVPKLIARHPDESLPLIRIGMNEKTAETIVVTTGVGEILFGLLILSLWNARWPIRFSIVAMIGLLCGVLATAPELALGAFNPVTLNVLVIVVSAIALVAAARKDEKSAL